MIFEKYEMEITKNKNVLILIVLILSPENRTIINFFVTIRIFFVAIELHHDIEKKMLCLLNISMENILFT